MESEKKIVIWKVLAKSLFNSRKYIYCKDFNDEYYIGQLLDDGNGDTFKIKCTGPSRKTGKEYELKWIMITKFDECRI